MKLKNKTILITGASKGIGKAIAILFAKEGCRLILVGRELNTLKLVINLLPVHLEEHKAFSLDISRFVEVETFFKTLKDLDISLDGVVNNAGVMRSGLLMNIKYDDILVNVNTNLLGTIHITKCSIKHMIRKRTGSIINMSSILGEYGSAGQSVYSATKSAIIGFTKSISKELAPLGIRVNAIAPGFIDTDLISILNEDIKASTIEKIGMKRIGKPDDVANLALFLISDQSNYITGQIIGIDGGMVV